MMTSESINELATALAKAQAQFTGAKQSGENPHLKKPYATLADVMDACRAPLTENGLSVVQMQEMTDRLDILTLCTRLMHSSGQWIESTANWFIGDKVNAQEVMKVLTYARRGGLSSMLGIAPDNDDDGHSASEASNQKRTQAPPKQTQADPPKPPTNGKALNTQVDALRSYGKHPDVAKFINGELAKMKVNSIDQLTQVQAAEMITATTKYRAEMGIK